jgi:butyryl-CoA dehydrogenase
MLLTEPDAGSDVGALTPSAVKNDDGTYSITGNKIFISSGEHDVAENIIHPVLARIEGAPQGTRGISLFLVPKIWVNEDGSLGEPNDVVCTGIEEKMGIHGNATASLSLGSKGNCRGTLLGEENKGMRAMFQMMNEARLLVGLQGLACASSAYMYAVNYARERMQGRHLLKVTEDDAPSVSIIEHPDVRRMLLFQRAIAQGSEGLLMQCALWEDYLKTKPKEEHERYELLLDLITPMCKTYPSEMAVHATSQAIQCLGGYGYCEDFPVEQHFRDCRIHPIHEGTTGIQGMDLLGRKVVIKEGKAFKYFLEEARTTIEQASGIDSLAKISRQLEDALQKLQDTTIQLAGLMGQKGPEVYLADATLYLEMFCIISVAWQWLKQAIAAQQALDGNAKSKDIDFYQGKLVTARFFFAYELPKIQGLIQRLLDGDPLTVEMQSSFFND